MDAGVRLASTAVLEGDVDLRHLREPAHDGRRGHNDGLRVNAETGVVIRAQQLTRPSFNSAQSHRSFQRGS